MLRLVCWFHGPTIIWAVSILAFWTFFWRQNLLRSLSRLLLLLWWNKYGAKNVWKHRFHWTFEMFNFSQSGSRRNNRKAFEGASMEPTSFNLHNKSNVRWGCVQQIFYAENHWKVKRKSESLLSRTISVQITNIFKWIYLHVMDMCVWWISLVPLSYQKVVIRAEILTRDFLQSLESYHMRFTTAKIQALTLSGPGGGGLRGPDGQTHSCQSETSYPMMPKLGDF